MKPRDHDDVVPDLYPIHSIPHASIQFEARIGRSLRIESRSVFRLFEFRPNPTNQLKQIVIHVFTHPEIWSWAKPRSQMSSLRPMAVVAPFTCVTNSKTRTRYALSVDLHAAK